MPFTIPDKGEGLNDIQSIWFQEYIDILVAGISGDTAVLSGCAVTAQGTPDMTVAVAAGSIRSAGTVYAVTAGNGTITAADATNPRLDLVVITSAGAIAVRAGTASSTPKPAARTAGDVVLAVVFVPAADTAIESNQIVDLRTVSGIPAGAFSHRNKIINGNFDIWQRGTSQTTSGYGSDDRWNNANTGTTKTHTKQAFALGQTDVPGEPTYFSRTEVTSVAGATNFCLKSQAIESVRTLAGKSATISFYAKADAAKNMAIELVQEFGSGGTPSAAVTGIGTQLIPLTASWQKFTRTITIPSITGKTLGTDNNDNLRCNFWFEAGSDYSARTAALGQQSGTFDIAQVQIEEGSVATPFEHRPYGTELALCKRYGRPWGEAAKGIWINTTTARIAEQLDTPMRAAPTVTLTTSTPVIENWSVATYTGSGSTVAVLYQTTPSIDIQIDGFTGPAVTNPLLHAYSPSNIVFLSAEL